MYSQSQLLNSNQLNLNVRESYIFQIAAQRAELLYTQPENTSFINVTVAWTSPADKFPEDGVIAFH